MTMLMLFVVSALLACCAHRSAGQLDIPDAGGYGRRQQPQPFLAPNGGRSNNFDNGHREHEPNINQFGQENFDNGRNFGQQQLNPPPAFGGPNFDPQNDRLQGYNGAQELGPFGGIPVGNPYPPQFGPGQFPFVNARGPAQGPYRQPGVDFPDQRLSPAVDGGVQFPNEPGMVDAGVGPDGIPMMGVPRMPRPMSPVGLDGMVMGPNGPMQGAPYNQSPYPPRVNPLIQIADKHADPPVQKIVLNLNNLSGLADNVRNRVRGGPDRRLLLPPFSRVMMSLIAPRMLRFQFDMMTQAIVAEVVRKVIFPLVGVIARGAGGVPSPPPPKEVDEIEDPADDDPPPVQVMQVPVNSGQTGGQSFVIQSAQPGMPVVAAQPVGAGTPGQVQFVLTATDPNGRVQPQQFVIQLQTGQATQNTASPTPVTATVIPVGGGSMSVVQAPTLQQQPQRITIPLSMLTQAMATTPPPPMAMQMVQMQMPTSDTEQPQQQDPQQPLDERQQQASTLWAQKANVDLPPQEAAEQDAKIIDMDIGSSNYGNFEHFYGNVHHYDQNRRSDADSKATTRKRSKKDRMLSADAVKAVSNRLSDTERASRWNAVLQAVSTDRPSDRGSDRGSANGNQTGQ